jgi:hypothetical protein
MFGRGDAFQEKFFIFLSMSLIGMHRPYRLLNNSPYFYQYAIPLLRGVRGVFAFYIFSPSLFVLGKG